MNKGESLGNIDPHEGANSVLFRDIVWEIGPKIVTDLLDAYKKGVSDGMGGAVAFPSGVNQHVIAAREGVVHVQYGSGEQIERFCITFDEARNIAEIVAEEEPLDHISLRPSEER